MMTMKEKAKAYERAIARAKEEAIDGYLDAVAVNDIFPELKEGEQKPAWSEEDEKMFSQISDILWEGYKNGTGEMPTWDNIRKWCLSIKDRVQSRSKQEWNEKDERIKNNLLSELTNLSVRKLIEKETEKKYASWLKAIKDRYAFKPSGEQVEAFEYFVRSIGESGYASPYDNNSKLLCSLLADLKKIKGE